MCIPGTLWYRLLLWYRGSGHGFGVGDGKGLGLSFLNITISELVIGKPLVIRQAFHRRRIKSEVGSLQRLLNIDFEQLDRIGRRHSVRKAFLRPAHRKGVVVEL